MKTIIAREIAARIWCDHEMEHAEMDPDLAEKIAQLLARNVLGKPDNPTDLPSIVVPNEVFCDECHSLMNPDDPVCPVCYPF